MIFVTTRGLLGWVIPWCVHASDRESWNHTVAKAVCPVSLGVAALLFLADTWRCLRPFFYLSDHEYTVHNNTRLQLHVLCQPLLYNVSSTSKRDLITPIPHISLTTETPACLGETQSGLFGSGGIHNGSDKRPARVVCRGFVVQGQREHGSIGASPASGPLCLRVSPTTGAERSPQFLGGGAANASCCPPPLPEVRCGEGINSRPPASL